MHRRRTRPHETSAVIAAAAARIERITLAGPQAPLPALDGGARSREPRGSYGATTALYSCMRGLEAAPSCRLRTEAHAPWHRAATRRSRHGTWRDCPSSRERPVAARAPLRALGIARNGRHGRFYTRSYPSRRAVRGSMSKHDRFFDKLERRAPKKRCRRCRQKFTPPAGHTSLICPPCRRSRKPADASQLETASDLDGAGCAAHQGRGHCRA